MSRTLEFEPWGMGQGFQKHQLPKQCVSVSVFRSIPGLAPLSRLADTLARILQCRAVSLGKAGALSVRKLAAVAIGYCCVEIREG